MAEAMGFLPRRIMKQTLFRDGVIERLPQLIGDGDSTFSVQSSVLENFRRVCKCMLGNSTMGVVAAGLNVSIDSSQTTVKAGYGITRGGDIVYLVRQWEKTDMPAAIADGDIVHVYLEYKDVDRGDVAVPADVIAGGGHSSWINRENISLPIIRDSAGAGANDSGDVPSLNPIIVQKDSEGPGIQMTDSRLYLGSAVFDGSGNAVFTPMSMGNEHVEYTFSHQFTSQLWASATPSGTTALLNNILTQSRILLPRGRKRIKQINILRFSPSTNAARTQTQYLINLSPISKKSGDGSGSVSVEALVMQDTVSSYFYETFTPSIVLEDEDISFQLSASVETAAFTTNTDANTNGVYLVEYVIEKLN